MRELLIAALLLSVAFAVYLGTPAGKGMLGEWRVRLVLGKSQKGVRYVLNDVTLVIGERTAQIDHVLVCDKGVYVIETKNYSGRIYGSDESKYWTQTLAYGKVKKRFYSPVKQNLVHAAMLGEILGSEVYISSVVVFTQNNLARVTSEYTVSLAALKSRLALPQNKKLYTGEEIDAIYQSIRSASQGRAVKHQHVRRVKGNKALVDSNICPRCARPLVTRNGRYGEFYGCSGYPECDFTKNK